MIFYRLISCLWITYTPKSHCLRPTDPPTVAKGLVIEMIGAILLTVRITTECAVCCVASVSHKIFQVACTIGRKIFCIKKCFITIIPARLPQQEVFGSMLKPNTPRFANGMITTYSLKLNILDISNIKHLMYRKSNEYNILHIRSQKPKIGLCYFLESGNQFIDYQFS